MMIDAPSAISIAAIILSSTQGAERLRSQLPLYATDRGESWLVRGTSFTDKKMNLQYCVFSTFVKKTDGQIQSINFSGRPILSDTEKNKWLEQMGAQQFAQIFGPPPAFEPDGRYLDLNRALYGGVINKPEDAIDYANVLIRLTPGLSLIPKQALQAVEKDGAWHISAEVPGHHTFEVFQFSRYDARILSGKL